MGPLQPLNTKRTGSMDVDVDSVEPEADLDDIKAEPGRLLQCIIKEENQDNESVFVDIKAEESKLEPIED